METIKKRKALKLKCNRSRTRHQKVEAQKLYQEAHKEVTRLIKEDKRDYFSSLATQAEDAAASGNMKDLYDTTKKLAAVSGEIHSYNNQVKDKEGNALTGDDDQLQRWIDHFSELLNRPSPTETPSIPEAPSELEVNCERPYKEENVKSEAFTRLRHMYMYGYFELAKLWTFVNRSLHLK